MQVELSLREREINLPGKKFLKVISFPGVIGRVSTIGEIQLLFEN
jgi:hypothetical protein